jgi:hypothetical protein
MRKYQFRRSRVVRLSFVAAFENEVPEQPYT